MRIFLIGYMGSGKTTTGRKMALLYDCPFIDLDTRIETTTGKSISEHFILGEDHFRKVEQQTLHNASTDSKFILSTGGGTPCFHGNMEWMNRNGITVYLKLDPLSLFHRLKASKRPRPLLEGKSDDELLEFIKSNLAEREPVYRQARYQVKGEDLDVLSLVNNINMGERQLR
ncbi:MAG: shikimate kinase [Bacteroidota bacterium]